MTKKILNFLELEQMAYENTEKWLKRTKNLIYKERQVEFENYISKHITCCYHSREVDFAVSIMEKLETENFKEAIKFAKSIFKVARKEDLNRQLIKDIVTIYSKKGIEFSDKTNKLRPRSPILKHLNFENSTFKKGEENAIKTEKKFLKLIELNQETCQNRKVWLDRTKNLIYKERQAEFESFISKYATCCYHGKEIDFAVSIMEKLGAEKNIEVVVEFAKNIFDNCEEQGYKKDLIEDMVTIFSKKGIELYDKTHKVRPRSPIIKHIDNENNLYKANEQKRKSEKEHQI